MEWGSSPEKNFPILQVFQGKQGNLSHDMAIKRNKVRKFPIVPRDIRQTPPHSPIADPVLQSSKTVLLKKNFTPYITIVRFAPCPRSGRALCALLFPQFLRWCSPWFPMMVVGLGPYDVVWLVWLSKLCRTFVTVVFQVSLKRCRRKLRLSGGAKPRPKRSSTRPA